MIAGGRFCIRLPLMANRPIIELLLSLVLQRRLLW